MPNWLFWLLKIAVLIVSSYLSYEAGVKVEQMRQPLRAFQAIKDYLQAIHPPQAPRPAHQHPPAPVPTGTKHRLIDFGRADKLMESLTDDEFKQVLDMLDGRLEPSK